MYVYASNFSIVVMLTHKDAEGTWEHPIAFHLKTLKDYEIKYNFMEKHTFSIVKGLKKFKHFISSNKMTIYISHSTIREYIMEGETTKNRTN